MWRSHVLKISCLDCFFAEMKILVTGSAGFIGFHCVNRFAADGHEVVGLDNINNYYDVALKYSRLNASGIQQENIQEGVKVQSEKWSQYSFVKGDISNPYFLDTIFSEESPFDVVVHLAAQAGVRYSLTNPDAYIAANVIGFYNILESCRKNPVKHLIYASSSSVYGNSTKVPFVETDMTDDTVSLYAATKKSNELFAYNYSHLFRIPTTGLRFFTVYGPWGRPDMAYYGFAEKICNGDEIGLFNAGDMYRDFTYIDDIVEGVSRLLDKPPLAIAPAVPKRILNIGNSSPVYMKDFIALLESKLSKKALINSLPMQETDVYTTYADISALKKLTGYHPATEVNQGLDSFLDWYRGYVS
jgi:UDP-glucuronate 4-epimerase